MLHVVYSKILQSIHLYYNISTLFASTINDILLTMRKNVGIGSLELLAGLLTVGIVSFAGWYAWSSQNSETEKEQNNNTTTENSAELSKYKGNYTLEDEKYGTLTTVVVNDDSRTITTNALPNHETGEFPNSGNPNTITAQDSTRVYPINPNNTGIATSVREPGVAINGVKFEPGTAETATCSTGEVYSIEAIQDITDLGLDFNNAHVQPNGEYHYHGISALLVDIYDSGEDLVHIGFAADGHLIYYSKTNAYKSSYRLGNGERSGSNCTYSIPGPSGGGTLVFDKRKDGSLTQDWDYDTTYGNLDECNGTTINGEYLYLVTNEFPYVSRCLMGSFTETAPSGGPPPQQRSPQRQ